MSDYVHVIIKKEPEAAVLGSILNVGQEYQLLQPVSRQADFPRDAHFDMLPDYGMQARDFVNNGSDVLVVSESVKEFIESQEDVRGVEMLSVTIVDHKGRGVEEQYYILHLLNHQDCIDEEHSDFERWASDPDNFSAVYELVLDETRVDPAATIFRLQRYPYPVIVHRNLAERILKAGFSGIAFGELNEYDYFEAL